jgi:hypothetical protein
MFYFSIIEDGPRGFADETEAHLDDHEVEDPSIFGIDWEDMEDDVLMEHHRRHNSQEPFDNPEVSYDSPFERGPEKLSEVICDPPIGPFDDEEIMWLTEELPRRVDVRSNSMLVRRQVWIHALDICKTIWATRPQ